jgi:hypothetical protein
MARYIKVIKSLPRVLELGTTDPITGMIVDWTAYVGERSIE